MRKVVVSKETRKRIAKFAGLGVGIALAVVALAAWRVPTSNGTDGADLQVAAQPATSLTPSSSDPFLVKTGLRPGGPAGKGSVNLKNTTTEALPFRVRATSTAADLDQSIDVELAVAGRPIYNGSLAALRQWAPSGFTLAPGQSARLSMSATLSQTATNYDGRVVDATLQFEPAGRNGDT